MTQQAEPLNTTVHVIRHGEVDNPEGILYGLAPGFLLSSRGEEMAKAAGQYLSSRDITYLVASPLERAQQTAQPVADLLGLPVATDERIVESVNVFAGHRVSRARLMRRFYQLYNPLRPSWGEPYRQIAQRMSEALFAARDAARGHEAVMVSHQLPIWTLRRAMEQRRLYHDPRTRECALGSITSFQFSGDKLVAIDYHVPAPELVAAALSDDAAKKRRRRQRAREQKALSDAP